MSSAISIRGLRFAYDRGHDVLRGVDLEIGAGERFGLIGPSGAGKSTLLLHLNGLLLPSDGEVNIHGVPVRPDTLHQIRSRVGMVFQNPDDQLFTPTVGEDVAFGPINQGLTPDKIGERVSTALDAMGLRGMEDSPSHHLSYGERKRAALATVLAMKPGIVAFDEPFSNLDPAMVEQLIGIIRGLEATVMVVSQSLLPMVAACERVAVLRKGEVIAVGPTGDILGDRDLLRGCGLDFHRFCEICDELLNRSSSPGGS